MYDLIYTDENRVEVGVLDGYVLTMTYGLNENNFDAVFGIDKTPCLTGDSLIYAEGTDYGGIVRNRLSNTDDSSVTFSGVTWHGVLDEHVICPPAGLTHFTFDGEANEALSSIILNLKLEEYFRVSDEDSGINVSASFRYEKGYAAICKMLTKANAKLVIEWHRDRAVLSVVPSVTRGDVNSSNSEFKTEESYRCVNHLICLGKGEMTDRAVTHWFIGADGQPTKTQYFFGLDEIVDVYEDTASEIEDLEEKGREKILELQEASQLDLTSELVDDYDVGDYVIALNLEAGISVQAMVTSKTVTIENGDPTFSCDVGSPSSFYEINQIS